MAFPREIPKSLDIADFLRQTHTARYFLHRLVDDLGQGRSVLVLFPRDVDYAAFVQNLDDLLRRQYDVVSFQLPEHSAEGSAPVQLANALQVQWESVETVRSVENLASCDGLPEIIHLREFERLAEDKREEWIAFVDRWTIAAKGLETQGKRLASFCLVVSADSLPEILTSSNEWFIPRWWWAIPSALEMRLLCRYGSESLDPDLDLKSRWREHIMPSLVGNDIDLAQFLWNDLLNDKKHILDRLQLWASHREWTSQLLQEWGIQKSAGYFIQNDERREIEPPNKHRDLWIKGLLNWTPEYGTMLSPAALAMLGENKAIEHRLWRGQVTLLMPLIDTLRLSLCERWTMRYGSSWAWRWQLPKSPEEADAVHSSPLASEWGHIEALIHNVAELRDERRLLPLVSHARYVRNTLAHYKTVTFRDFEVLWYESQKRGR